MTGQIADKIIYKNEAYSLIGVSEGELFTPEQFGMTPVMIHTGCWRGFYVTYELTDAGLSVIEFTLREKDGNYVRVQGVEAVVADYQGTYQCLNIPIQFTGTIRLAKDFIQELYIHMGFQKPSAFKTVLDITLKDGKIVEVKDLSDDMEKERGLFKKRFDSGDIQKSIEDAFSLDLEIK